MDLLDGGSWIRGSFTNAEDFDGFVKTYIEYLLEKNGPLESMATLEYMNIDPL